MRSFTTAALCAFLASAPALAQAPPQDQDVYPNDLPETHDDVALPGVDRAAGDGAFPPELRRTLEAASSASVAAQQLGNLATTKRTSGVVRDLGDVMALLHSEINERLREVSDDGAAMPDEAGRALEALARLNEESFAAGMTFWVASVYPEIISTWRALGEEAAFAALSRSVVEQLEGQLAVAEAMIANRGEELGPRATQALQWGSPAGGQAEERQHTPEPETAAVQTGENYRQEEVSVDESVQTRRLGESAEAGAPLTPAGGFTMLDSGSLFMAISNLDTELQQLQTASGLEAERVRVTPAEDVLRSTTLADVRASVEAQAEGIASMRQAIGSNEAIRQAVEAADASIEEVIALDVLGEGVMVYTFTSGAAAE